MEVNGPANIKMLLSVFANKAKDPISGEEIVVLDKQVYESLMRECDLTVEYMRAYADALLRNEKPPKWHDIKKESTNISLCINNLSNL